MKEFKKIYLTGDYHAVATSFKFFAENRLKADMEAEGFAPTDVAVIVLGDFGMNLLKGCGRPEVEEFYEGEKKTLEDSGVTFFAIRGNHDQRPSKLFNSEEWHFEQLFDGPTFVENKYLHIHYAMDYPWVYNIGGYKTLVLPGACSVDKHIRLYEESHGGIKTWFEDEAMDKAEQEYAMSLARQNDFTFDMILSHTCPYWYLPRYSLNYKAPKEMEYFFAHLLNEIEEKGTYKGWAWGHHHEDGYYRRPDGRYDMILYNEYVPVDDFMEMKGHIQELYRLG